MREYLRGMVGVGSFAVVEDLDGALVALAMWGAL